MSRKGHHGKWNMKLVAAIAVIAILVVALILVLWVLPRYGIVIVIPGMSAFGGAAGGGQPPAGTPPDGVPAQSDRWVSLSLNPSSICVAEATTANVRGNMPSASCGMFYRVTLNNWLYYGTFRLDGNSAASNTVHVYAAGQAVVRATCVDGSGNYRNTNEVTLTVAANCDSDNDGFSNEDEVEAGTDPFDPSSHPTDCNSKCQDLGYASGRGPVDSPGRCNYPEVYMPSESEGCCCTPKTGPACSGVEIPTSVGDKGGYCAENGICPLGDCCDNYFDYASKIHHCACTLTSFCGQYCYNYNVGSCECPPTSHTVWLTSQLFQCVPDGYTCVSGVPVLG